MQISGEYVRGEVIDGKLVKATIELPPVDIDKIRKGDEVWVRGRWNENGYVLGYSPTLNIIAHFSATPEQLKPEEKMTVELPEKYSSFEMAPSLGQILSKINALIDAVAQLAERIK